MKAAGKQLARLTFIDFMLMYVGSINRSEIMSQFKIAPAGATRDLKAYKEQAADNIFYDLNQKTYFAKPTFKPLYAHSAEDALRFFSSENLAASGAIKCSSSYLSHSIRNEILAPITRAMSQGKVVSLTYHNPFSGSKDRDFVPNVLVNDGLRWHVRGYCRLRMRFIDLVLSRIENARILDEKLDEQLESIEQDRQWNRFVDLEIVPHPDIDNQRAIEYEHQMVDGALRMELRAAIVGYFLRSWNVDCTSDHSLNKYEYHLWLKNLPTLYGVNNAKIAPGFRPVDIEK